MSSANGDCRARGPFEGIFAQLRSMGVPGGFVGNDAQAEPLAGIEAGRLEPAVVPTEALGLAIFQEQLTIVSARQGIVDDVLHTRFVQSSLVEEQFLGMGGFGHLLYSTCI